MNDPDIIRLYLERSEAAVSETKTKYGSYLRTIALRILSDFRDAEEAESDAYLKAWNTIPPEEPKSLKAYVGRLCRNSAIDIYRRASREKRGGGAYEEAFCELDALTSGADVAEAAVNGVAFSEAVNAFLRALPERKRRMFVQRYWYFMTVAEIAKDNYTTKAAVDMQLSRLRASFGEYLKREGLYYENRADA